MDRISELRQRSIDSEKVRKQVRKRKIVVAVFWFVILLIVAGFLFS